MHVDGNQETGIPQSSLPGRRVSVYTLGCKLNYAETATLTRTFRERGFEAVAFGEPADIVLINTCSVTANADRDARKIVRRALRQSPEAFVIVAGCYAQLRPEEIASIPGVDLVLGSDEKFRLFDFAEGFEKGAYPRIHVGDIGEVDHFGPAYAGDLDGRTRSFLKVQDGCDYTCAFCTIPLARGFSRSVDTASIVATARDIVADGFREIVLSGVNVGDYGRTLGSSLYELLKRLLEITGDFRIRISSIEPNLLTDEIIRLAAGEERFCRHFHVPLQSGSDAVLKLMRRRYGTALYRDRIESILSAVPGAGIGIDVIVGHPGETERDFLDTYNFLVALPFSYLHVFSYSERPETHALNILGSVPAGERARRSAMLRTLSEKKRRAFFEAQCGHTLRVLFESEEHDGMITGLTDNYIRVGVPFNPHLAGQLLRVKLNAVSGAVVSGSLADATGTHTGYVPLPILAGGDNP